MNKILLLAVILMMIMSSCAAPVEVIIPTKDVTQIPTDTPLPTTTPTLEPTSTPTVTPTPYPTPTLMPTPTPVEWELVPYFEKVIEYEWKGVLIKARLIIDESTSSKIESIEISDEILAEVVARWMYLVWRHRNGYESWNDDSYFDIDDYMEMWAKAQDSGLESDWRKVQINDIWANDLTDGDGYVQAPYNVWPMYYGDDAPDGVTPLNLVTLAFVAHDTFDNITNIVYVGMGTNLSVEDLLVYRSFNFELGLSPADVLTVEDIVFFEFASTSTWLAINNGGWFKSHVFGNRNIYMRVAQGVDVTYK